MDDKLASAISHWAPRFTTNGVTVGDFEAITAGLQRWSDWCAAWSASAVVYEELGRQELEDKHTRSAGAHLAQAAVYYHYASTPKRRASSEAIAFCPNGISPNDSAPAVRRSSRHSSCSKSRVWSKPGMVAGRFCCATNSRPKA